MSINYIYEQLGSEYFLRNVDDSNNSDDFDSDDEILIDADEPVMPVIAPVMSAFPVSVSSMSVSELEPSKKKTRISDDGLDEMVKSDSKYGLRTLELYREIIRVFPSKKDEARSIFSYGGNLMYIYSMHHDHMLKLYNQLFGTNLTF